MIPIGPLVPSAILDGKDPRDTSFDGGLLPVSNHYPEWLDSKQENLVDYGHNEIVLSMKRLGKSGRGPKMGEKSQKIEERNPGSRSGTPAPGSGAPAVDLGA
ncbi:hypothetical protein Fmac_017846 [Flemingia macrophylla]|uniref:Uncharacterized protein n=1 Tax=Flemingia macrophylla TaxID=520843 RepID=A0ABD1M3C2_9FABA